MNIVRLSRNRLSAAAAAAGALLLPAISFAQTDPFADAVTQATTKVTSYGGSLVGLAVVSVLFFIAIKYVKKITRAA